MDLGCHLSSSQGFYAMGETACSIGANTFQFFTRNPRGGKAKALDLEDCQRLRQLMAERSFGKVIAHAPYTINPCAAVPKTLEFAHQTLADDLQRMEALPGQLYNFHPGSHVGQGTEAGIEMIAELLNAVLSPDMHTTVLLETMAGKGSEIGGKFEELREIIDRVELKDKLGVCLDTCHIWDGGYDIVSDPDAVFAEFDRVIGLDKLRAVHLNNSLNLLDSHKDRHAKILEGKLPPEALARIVCHEALAGRPIILETPNDDAGYAAEIAWLREQWAARHG